MMNDNFSKLCTFAVENGIQIARLNKLMENPNKQASGYEPKWFVHVVLFDSVTIKRMGVHVNQQNELYLKPSQDMSMLRYGGDTMDSIQLNAAIKDEIVKLIKKELGTNSTLPTGNLVDSTQQFPHSSNTESYQ
ncbi:MAG: hypothetical protein ACRDCC_08205 [Culicoidibacterales bacterium]